MTDIAVELPDKELLIHYPAFLMEKYLEGGPDRQKVVSALTTVFSETPENLEDIRHMARMLATEGKNPLPLYDDFIGHITTTQAHGFNTISDHNGPVLPMIA